MVVVVLWYSMKTHTPYNAYTIAQDFGDDLELIPLLEGLIRRHKTAHKKLTKFVPIADPYMAWVMKEFNELKAEQFHGQPMKLLSDIIRLTTAPKEEPNGKGVTDIEIARAREYPLTNLVVFKRGFAGCPWHGERTGSLHILPNTNETKAHCHGACKKTYDSIDAYMMLHNCNFITAVKALAS